jgi:ankyrin repeat protein
MTIRNYNGDLSGNCLHISAARGYDSIIKLLLEDCRVDRSIVSKRGGNCVHLSAIVGHASIFGIILEDLSVDPRVVNNLHLLAERGYDTTS